MANTRIHLPQKQETQPKKYTWSFHIQKDIRKTKNLHYRGPKPTHQDLARMHCLHRQTERQANEILLTPENE